jgi:hypothetical protein
MASLEPALAAVAEVVNGADKGGLGPGQPLSPLSKRILKTGNFPIVSYVCIILYIH